MNKIKILLDLLSEESIDELTTKLEMAYTQECIRYCDDIMVHGQGNLPEPVRMAHLWELNCSINELRAL